MRVTYENINALPILASEKGLLRALLLDVQEINEKSSKPPIYIDWQDYHNEYSPERTDPCPDYYGYYTLRSDALIGDSIGSCMSIDELNDALYILCDYVSEL